MWFYSLLHGVDGLVLDGSLEPLGDVEGDGDKDHWYHVHQYPGQGVTLYK